MIDRDEFWGLIAALGFFFGFLYLGLGVYLAIKRNPQMDRFLYDDARLAESFAAGGIPFGFMRAGEYGFYFLICRLFGLPIKKFFKRAQDDEPNHSTALYEVSVVFGTLSVVLMTFVYFVG